MAVHDMPTIGTRIDTLDGLAAVTGGFGPKLTWARQRAAAFRPEFASTGVPDSITTCDLVTLPYPTRMGLFRASRALAPFLAITNRMLVIRWAGKILLFEPSDVESGRNTPYFAALAAKFPAALRSIAVREHGDVPGHLRRLGIAPEQVDYLMFDHLHTQDLRRWIGTTRAGDPPALFPNARVIVQRDELTAMADLHPLQRPWYQPEAFTDLDPEKLLPIEGSVLLGPGVAAVSTPGHVLGNQSLLLNTATGIWASSENVIAAECLTPEHSRLPGLAAWSRTWGQELILNANTLETAAEQYNSLILEKSLVDVSQRDPRFLQFLPSSELTAQWTNPGTRPTFTHGRI
ncbi:hypothetical protein [Actinoplanes sp. L3-i22]|uniref:hypothetical protein n=1 Tax=Actinoplanes sp. L3-i22 TaxID=2836373 RepID=UPI001C75BC99|nr:hypothetical protein [Actinoplanes sp. L3-i22]BCY08641.1 hypothetical protein L3i22_037290 [Actinoplanes sp. L3-i22]